MKYGLIGEKLSHSFSKAIHESLADYEYELVEIERNKLCEFLKKREFSAINVTIPYKEEVIPNLDCVDEMAREIGAVNTVVNKDGKLFGYNTDFFGMSELIKHAKIEIKDKKVLILGSGGTSKTASAVVRSLGAKEVQKVSRSARDGAISYEDAYEKYSDADVIINTTPSGMYPSIEGMPIYIDKFSCLSGVIDAVYNPLRTALVCKAKEKGIAAEGGLYMLVAQAVRASEIFLDTKYDDDTINKIYSKMLKDKENIVLSGMPGSGKSTIGKLLAERLGREFIDLDEAIVKREGREITEIFVEGGESLFRDIETKAVRETAIVSGAVIATGGGAILRDENVRLLKQNGRIYFLDRPIEQLVPTSDRPLASSRDAIINRYNERFPRYKATCDFHLKTDGVAEHAAENIIEDFEG